MRKKALVCLVFILMFFSSCVSRQYEETSVLETTTNKLNTDNNSEFAIISEKFTPPQSWGEWFLSPITYNTQYFVGQSYPEYGHWMVKTPKEAVITRDHLEITLNFFKENYYFGEALQVRIIVKNISSSTFRYFENAGGCGIRDVDSNTSVHWEVFSEELIWYTAEWTPQKEISPQETREFEYMFLIEPSFFENCGVYTFWFDVIHLSDQEEYDFYHVEIPLEVIAN